MSRAYDAFGGELPRSAWPKFRVWCPERGHDQGDARTFRELSAQDAAEAWAEQDDVTSAEYSIVAGQPVTLLVRSETGELSRFEVRGESLRLLNHNETPAAGIRVLAFDDEGDVVATLQTDVPLYHAEPIDSVSRLAPPWGSGPARMTKAEWLARGRELFGDDMSRWRFVCPSCGHVATVRDWRHSGAGETAIAFSCVGRWLSKCVEMGERPGPCNYAGGGLFRLNPVCIVEPDGREHNVFAFDEPQTSADTEAAPALAEGGAS